MKCSASLLVPFLCHVYFHVWPEGHRERSMWSEKAKAAYEMGREVGVAWTTVHYLNFPPLDWLWMQSLSQLNSFPFDSGKSISTWGKTPGYRNWKYSVKLDTGYLLFALSALLATSLCSAPCKLREADWMDISGFPHSSQMWTMGNPSRRVEAQRKESELRVVTCLVPSLWGCLMLDVSVN